MAEETVTRDELRQRIEDGDADFRAYLSTLNAEQMTAPALDDGWSVKDVIGHVTAWHEVLLDWLAARERGEQLTELAPGYPWGQTDALNQHLYEQRTAWALDDALASYRDTLSTVLDALDGLSDAELNEPPADPEAPLVWQWFAINTYEHVADHIGWMREAFGDEATTG
jgi:hypothetical protein